MLKIIEKGSYRIFEVKRVLVYSLFQETKQRLVSIVKGGF